MIEVIAEVEVARGENHRIDRRSGNDAISGKVTTSTPETVRIHLELNGVDERGGYVNLEGFVPSSGSGGRYPIRELFGRYLDLDRSDEVLEAEVELRGEVDDWIGAASRYLDERPDMDLADALRLFRSWKETPTSTIDRAIEEVGA